MQSFIHLHNHTHYSLLDGASHIPELMDKAVKDGQKGIAITDHGNMFGVFEFVTEAKKRDLKPIVGCEFYLVADRHKRQFQVSKGERDNRFHQLLLAKDQDGYQNLSKLCSLGFIEGVYSGYPRIDKELLLKYHKGLIATSCCIGAEIPQTILTGNIEKAEELLRWWLDVFGEDYYIELQRHRGMDSIDDTGMSQEQVNQVLLGFAKKYNIKVIATNDAHYINEDDARAHDILLCVNTGKKISEQGRFQFPSTDFYFKSQLEMNTLFHDVPAALDFTNEIFDKITAPHLTRDVLLPNFPVPKGFDDQTVFLRHLVYEGARMRYGTITKEIQDRLDWELSVIDKMGFNGYFLIVQDFIKAARKMDVSVGPGRGSGAGSAVAYCLTITNIDPLRYNLLFERFLNPERVSMPDFDIDFDDEGRQRVIDYVVDKYGRNQVAQIVTFGTMAAKSSIRDVGRVLELPLPETDRLAKMVPATPGTSLHKIFQGGKEAEAEIMSRDLDNIKKLREIEKQETSEGEILRLAQQVEGTVRNTGIHAAGVIIAPGDIMQYIPVCTSSETELLVTQFEGNIVESAGMLKMDFLGLKTLSIVKDSIKIIAERLGTDKLINPDEIPLDDPSTFTLFQKGETIGIFQFESVGMQKYLRELVPTNIEDLIAMNALYRPGPMNYIPMFINRKHGKEPVEYPHPWIEEMLKPTYGIMVYQEQIMQAAQIMAGYSLGAADMLRRAMGKKKADEMEKHRKIFVDGAVKKGVDEAKASDIFEMMSKFASYGFNRSHSAAYTVLSVQTAWLKTHYPAEFMAAVLTHNKHDIAKLNFFLRECKRMNIPVLPPDVNESNINFTVNSKGAIRFGLSALKNMGEGSGDDIIRERRENGPFQSIFDLTSRVTLKSVNKKALEAMVMGGALDCFEGAHRAQYFAPTDSHESLIEHAIRYGQAVQSQKSQSQLTLFGDSGMQMFTAPPMPNVAPWSLIEKLTREKEITGIYMSGHPLDDYRLEIEHFTNCPLDMVTVYKDKHLKVAGIVTNADHRITQKGTGWGIFTLQDFRGSLEVRMFNEDYKKYRELFTVGEALYIEGFYQLSWNGQQHEFRITSARLLASIGEELTKSITVKISVDQLDDVLLNNLDKICGEHKGRHKLRLQVYDREDDFILGLISKTNKVKANSVLIGELDALGLKYKLN
ncbi:MAG TPA: DNA polymerase III subunit alpha [Saprospiraceae bacterium]|nr:DNA polymerase III subunit alpha [Saprospiraceae bacterium]